MKLETALYSVNQKSTPQLFTIFSLVVNLCNENYIGYCRNIFLWLHQFWSIYL